MKDDGAREPRSTDRRFAVGDERSKIREFVGCLLFKRTTSIKDHQRLTSCRGRRIRLVKSLVFSFGKDVKL
jgi:hypothetical protein